MDAIKASFFALLTSILSSEMSSHVRSSSKLTACWSSDFCASTCPCKVAFLFSSPFWAFSAASFSAFFSLNSSWAFLYSAYRSSVMVALCKTSPQWRALANLWSESFQTIAERRRNAHRWLMLSRCFYAVKVSPLSWRFRLEFHPAYQIAEWGHLQTDIATQSVKDGRLQCSAQGLAPHCTSAPLVARLGSERHNLTTWHYQLEDLVGTLNHCGHDNRLVKFSNSTEI